MEFEDLKYEYVDVKETKVYGLSGIIDAPSITCTVKGDGISFKKTMAKAELDLLLLMRKIRGFITDQEMMDLIRHINELGHYEREAERTNADSCNNDPNT